MAYINQQNLPHQVLSGLKYYVLTCISDIDLWSTYINKIFLIFFFTWVTFFMYYIHKLNAPIKVACIYIFGFERACLTCIHNIAFFFKNKTLYWRWISKLNEGREQIFLSCVCFLNFKIVFKFKSLHKILYE